MANKAKQSEFKRASKLSQKEYCQILTRHSQTKENRKEKIRKQSQDVEVLDCTFEPKVNHSANKKMGYP